MLCIIQILDVDMSVLYLFFDCSKIYWGYYLSIPEWINPYFLYMVANAPKEQNKLSLNIIGL